MSDHSSRVPKWVWVFTPTLAVAFAGFVLYLSTIPASDESGAVRQDAEEVFQALQQQAVTPPVEKPNYEFYRLLEQQEVKVDKVKEYVSTPKGTPKRYSYRLQVASFRGSADADRMRAELLLAGMNAYVESSTVNDSTWYRVYVGPFTNRSKMNKAQDQLAQRNISPLVLKTPLAADG
ncbi:sporulation protein [Bacterioplanes sanyensis]|uniref:Sporulation protein n=1 Tax=Bacterioplanes sanyensis TaxID=1249553 RepID=A0A222FGQ1_9GAMM|nr:SPOR domain-containing protein [Bacterioplanes sanyensis]ASP38247.1 sporulation protein [Bacterioplanes sanyensis]